VREEVGPREWLPMFPASLRSLIIWRTNCAVHDDIEETGRQTNE